MRNVSGKKYRENKNIRFIFSNIPGPPPPKNRVVCDIMWENDLLPDTPQMTIKYGACAVHAGYLRLQTYSQNV